MHQTFTRGLLTVALLSGLHTSYQAQAQSLDPAFQPTTLRAPLVAGLQQAVNTLVVQADGKVVVAGGFDFVNGQLTGKLQRLNADGTTDASFNVGGMGANGFITSMVQQPDGKLLVGGGFNTFNGQDRPLVVRLNANGTLDASFTFGTGTSIRQIGSLALQPDGKILVGSGRSFTGAQTGGLVRLNSDGSVDTSFNIGTGIVQPGSVSALLVQADGKIVVGGSFLDFNDQVVSSLLRLTSTGALDPAFVRGTPTVGTVSALAQQSDGKLLVGGNMTQYNGQTVSRLIRLATDGTLDAPFAPVISATVRSIVVEPAGTILIGGAFTTINGSTRNRIARLTSAGADAGFATGTGANSQVFALGLTTSGQVVAGGGFTQYDGLSRGGVVRLSPVTGEAQNDFTATIEPRGTISQAVPLATGQLLVAGNFTQYNGQAVAGANTDVRLVNVDGSLVAGFASGLSGTIQEPQLDGSFYLIANSVVRRVLASGTIDNSLVNAGFGPTTGANAALVRGTVRQADGKLLVFGRFASYGSRTGLYGLVRLNPDGSPDNTFQSVAGPVFQSVNRVIVQSSGKIVVGLDDITGTQYSSTLFRLNANGSPDNTFPKSNLGMGIIDRIDRIFAQPDGHLILRGNFSSYGGQPIPNGLARITADGVVDNIYPGLNNVNNASILNVQTDGRLLAISGASAPTNASAAIVRLNTDGSLDASFNPVAMPQSIFTGDDVLNDAVLQPTDNKIILYGSFRYVAGQVRIGLARLTNVGTLATRAAAAVQPLDVYPNPTHGTITVALPAATQARPATLLDILGRPVRTWTLPARQRETTLGLEAVPAGVYLLRVEGESAVYQQKVIVTR